MNIYERQQNEFLKILKFKSFLPWNSVQRRNVAILKSLQEKCDLIVKLMMIIFKPQT